MKLADLFNEGVNDPGIFKAVFLAGGPGSGKSFVGGEVFAIPSANSFSPAGLKVVNSDPEFEYFLKKQGIDPKTLGKMTDKQFQKVTTGPESPREKAKRIKDAKDCKKTIWAGSNNGTKYCKRKLAQKQQRNQVTKIAVGMLIPKTWFL